MPFFFVSAADGTNVVKVFEQAVGEAVRHRDKVKDMMARGEGEGGDEAFMAEVRDTLKYFDEVCSHPLSFKASYPNISSISSNYNIYAFIEGKLVQCVENY